ncbi:MAG: hypothetical protein IKP07_00060 [Bacilli bacterium]|nr:hypothetical protein [Bacilli bacterium]
MKNITKYLLFIIICLIGFVGITKAYDLHPNEEMILITNDEEHKSPKCEVTKGELTASPYTMVPASGQPAAGGSVVLRYNKQVSGSGEIVIDCTYKSIHSNEEVTTTYWYEYGIQSEGVTADMFVILDNFDNTPYNLAAEAGVDSVISLTLEDNKGIIKKNCSGKKCEISINDSFTQIGKFRVYGTFKYKKTISGTQVEYTAKVIIDAYINNGATLDITKTNLGTCGTPNASDWISADDDPDIYNPGNDKLYFSTRLGTLSFPNCQVKTESNPLLEFKGWVGQKRGSSHASESVSIQGVHSCARYSPKKGSFAVEAGTIYFPCYDYGKGIIVFGNGKRLDVDNTWNPYTSVNSYYKMSENKIQLPNAILEGEFSQNQSIKGWKNKDTGEVVAPGTYVDPDGSTYILITETQITYRNYYKSIYANEAYRLNPSDGKVTGCESANTSFITNVGTGECILMGHKSTEDEYIDVTVFGENGYQRVFHVRVVSRNGRSESGDEAFVINVTPNIVASLSDSGTLNNYFIETCDSFSLSSADPIGSDPTGTNILTYNYVPEGCGYGGNYLSYCIDAGRTGPLPENGIEYIKSETIDMNSDFGKLITYMGRMGMFTSNSQDILDVTTLVRIVGIIDNLTVASEHNSQDTAHAGSYQYYKSIAEQIVGAGGKIDPGKVDRVSGINARVKTVLKEYQNVEDYTGSNFERTIDNIIYSEIDASGNYTVSYEGLMVIPGDDAELHPPTAISGTVDKFDPAPDDRIIGGRTTYEYKVTISGNVNTMTLPRTGTNSNTVTDQAKAYSFKLEITSGGQAKDVFITEPSGRSAGDGYQRMLSVNTSEPIIYVYFSPAPSVKACGGIAALDPSNPSLNETLFRAAGCCNMPALDERFLDRVCTNTCISTNIGNVCEYRDNFDINNPVADFYEINEGKKGDDYKIGSGEGSECIVKTDDMGWSRSAGMLLNNSSVNKMDDAGNSLMVDSYKNNRYCRVSCSENWQLSMEAFGNFVGDRAIAAGSYFAVNDTDMFVSGKRTCYTTFINYGNTNVSTEVGAGDQGFTKDLSDSSDKLVEDYNKYSNLSHVYADLACENDEEYTTEGGHTVKCDYSDINGAGVKFCSKYTSATYCWNKEDVDEGSKCSFEVDAWNRNYCIDADGKDGTDTLKDGNCSFVFNATYKDPWYTCDLDYGTLSGSKCNYTGYTYDAYEEEQDDGTTKWTCDSGTVSSYTSNGVTSYRCKHTYSYDATYHAGYWYCNSSSSWPTGYSSNLGPKGKDAPKTEQQTCTYNYTKTFYGCEATDLDLDQYEEIPDEYREDFYTSLTRKYGGYDPEYGRGPLILAYARDDLMKHAGAMGTFEDETGPGVFALSESAVDYKIETNDSQTSHKCTYSYAKRSANICTEWSICLSYWTRTTNKVDDGDTTPEGEETAPGQYVFYQIDSTDGKLNPETKPVAELPNYDKSGAIKTGDWTGVFSMAYDSLAYQNLDEARLDGADESGLTLGGVPRYERYARSTSKYFITGDELKVCSPTTSSMPDGLSYSGGNFVEAAAGAAAVEGGSNVMLRDVGPDATCWTEKWPNCHIKTGTEEKYVLVLGNYTPFPFYTYCGVGEGTQEKPEDDSYGSCDTGSTCDTDRARNIRRTILENSGIKGKLSGYASDMIVQNNNIVTYSKDMFACQHFELYNASDGENNERKNNTLWASNFMGTRRSFTRIVSSFEPQISYSYDEAEYMTLLNDDNVMERFNDLNDQTYGCYTIRTNSGEHGCYNNSTNKRVETSVKRYRDGEQVGSDQNVTLSRNYTENYYYDLGNDAWPNNSLAAKSYGEAEKGAATETKLTCNGSDCNIGDQLGPVNMYKRTVLCSIGLVNDEPILSSHSDGKSSSLFSVYVNDKDFFWTAGTCFVNQVQYIQANYIKASIENSSFYKNKGFWYVNNSNDAKAHGDNLINALENSNDILKATYNVRDEKELGAWSVEGGYNVFPIKLNTPRDLYTYRYQFAEIGSYGDGKLGRVMGTDQSLVAINERVCFYEVFEELCLCCGNPINAHTMSDAPYEFVNNSRTEYVMSLTNNPLVPSATIAINTSNISLSDMQSDSNRDLGENWSEESLFFYDGEDFYTNKGAELLKEIQSEGRGENIYSETPEYRFVINPQGMSEIRKYNDDHGYGLDYYTLSSTGRYAIMPYDGETFLACNDLSGCEWEIPASLDEDNYPQNRIINFTHFKSDFLEKELKESKYANKVNFTGINSNYDTVIMRTDCYVTENDVSTIHDKAESCRWVDYIQPMEHTDASGNTNTYYYRLAYK